MKKVFGGLLLLLVVLVPLVSSFESELTVKVDDSDDLMIRVLEPNLEQDILLGTIEMSANSEGLARKMIKFDKSIVWFKIMILDENSAVQNMKYFKKAYKMGEPIYIDFWEVQKDSSEIVSEVVSNNSGVNLSNLEEVSSNESEVVTNESDVEEVVVEVEEDSTQDVISGEAVTGTSSNSSMADVWSSAKSSVAGVPRYFLFVVPGLIILLVLTVVLRSHFSSGKLAGGSSYDFGNDNRQIRVAEAQIKKAQEKIKKLQNKKRIKALEEKIQSEKSSLKKTDGNLHNG